MLPQNLALVADTNQIGASELTKVAAALQKQATRDFGPLWGVDANVSAFTKLEDVPTDYWPVIVRDDIHEPGAAGVHMDQDGQPFALVQYGSDWSLTASHETLEMLGDPFGNRLVAGKSPKSSQGRVNFLVEVCDPSEAATFSYTINGIAVSDFYTPHFFDPVTSPGVRYSYSGAITKPRSVLQGGYLSWVVPKTNAWFQMTWFGGSKPKYRSLGVLSGKITGSLRSTIDRLTPTPIKDQSLLAKAISLTAARETHSEVEEASAARAANLRQAIKAVKARK